MFEFVSPFVHDHWFVLLLCSLVGVVLVWFYRVQLHRWGERERLAREVEDALIQNAQSVILNVHGLVKNLPASDPTRQEVERVLDRADKQLSEDRDRAQNLRPLQRS